MRITLVQTALVWEDPEANKKRLAEKIAHLAGHTDLILLPEMFTTGFSVHAMSLADPDAGSSLEWMRKQASILGAAICGSVIALEDGRYYNRLLFVKPDGSFDRYDKKHLFTMAGEHKHFTAGTSLTTVEWLGWRIRPLICYDLRFPEWARNEPDSPYDLLIYVANWPAKRAAHWRNLLTARAIENQAYVAGLNIVGIDGNALEYLGDASVIDYNGHKLLSMQHNEMVNSISIDKAPMYSFREKLPFLKDADV